jgi:putative hydrolase of the HAD superfamily
MTKAIIFDLDSCLAAADEVGEQLFAPAFAAIRAANDGSVPEEKLRTAFAECWRVAFDAVADKYGSDAGRRLAGVPADGGYRAGRRLIPLNQSSGSVPSLRILRYLSYA